MNKYEINEKTGNYKFKRVMTSNEILQLAFEIAEKENLARKYISSSDSVKAHLRARFMGLKKEIFGCIYLDNQNTIISDEVLFTGTINVAPVFPREIAVNALKQSAKKVILFHNHPSGFTEPSQADINITTKIKDALSLIEVEVLDHVIVGTGGVTSLAERGYI